MLLMDENKAKRFEELHLKLTKLKAINKRTHILYILAKIREIPEQPPLFACLNRQIPPAPPVPLPGKTFKYEIILMEPDLIKDIFSILTGTTGIYLKPSQTSENYEFHTVKVLSPSFHMTEKISELAFLHNSLKAYIKTFQVCQTCKLLTKHLENELLEYDEFIMNMQKNEKISMKMIDMWCDEPIERMKNLVLIADCTEGLKGSQVVSMIFNLAKTGNSGVNLIMVRVLEMISKGLANMLELWIQEGVIDDPYQEFFIIEDILVGPDELWERKYRIEHDMVPSFFGDELVKKILLIGKSINFVKICCNEPWVSNRDNSLPRIFDIEALDTYIDNLAASTNQFLLSMVNIKYNLELHFSSLKKYLLLTQGDFHHCLMEELFTILDSNAKSIYKHIIVQSLERSIRSTSLKHHDSESISRLDIKLLEASPLDSGWDIFLLDYILSPPLTTIFTSKVLESYQRAFKFLWQIKRAHYLLTLSPNSRSMIKYQTYYELKQVMHEFQLLRHDIFHFINNLFSYLILEVVEAPWKKFSSRLENAKGLDDMIGIHEEFLKSLLEKAFLDDEGMYRRVLSIVEICVKFYDVQVRLFKAAEEEKERREIYIRVGTIEELMIFDEFLYDIQMVKAEFYDEFSIFQKKLIEPKLIYLKFLAFRMDFNEYYELKSLEYVM